MSKNNSWFLLSRLRRAVKKVSFLLNFNMNRWRFTSMLSRSSSAVNHIRSFNEWPAGLIAVVDYYDEKSEEGSVSSCRGSSRTLQRTISCPLTDQDDIDERAEMFIANFRRQLQIERQVSLELRYCRGNSFGMVSP